MAQLERWHGVLFSPSQFVPKGKQLLWNCGRPVICVPIGAPIEDAEFDHVQLNPADYENLRTLDLSAYPR